MISVCIFICFHKLTCISQKRLFMPYLQQVGGDHQRDVAHMNGSLSFCHQGFLTPLPSLHTLPDSPPPPSAPSLEASLLCQMYETIYSYLEDLSCLNPARTYRYNLAYSCYLLLETISQCIPSKQHIGL